MVHVHQHLPELFRRAIATTGHRELLGARAKHGWHWLSPDDTSRAVDQLAAGLIALGIQPGDRVGLISENRPEWVISDFAVLHCGAADVPVYPTLPADQTAYVLADAGVRAVITSNQQHAQKIIEKRAAIPTAEHLVCFEPGIAGTISLEELCRRGQAWLAANPDAIAQRVAAIEPDTLATLIYTSGTTGQPKGVMLTHGNFCHNVGQVLEALQHTFTFGYRAVSFLPLCHATERLVTYAYLQAGMAIGYVGHVERIADACEEINPHLVVSVPGVLALIRSRIQARLAKESPRKRAWLERTITWGIEDAEWLAAERPLPIWRRLRRALCERVLYRKLRARLGTNLLAVIVGGAALPIELCRFFWGIGLAVIEGYGMTEASPVISVNRRGGTRFGTVGPPLPNLDLRIAEDGEILAKGPNVMRGYWNRPEETAATLRDGWLATGDLGRLEDRFLVITGRKKEILVLSTGKNVPPRLIEDLLDASPYIKYAVAVGDNRPAVAVLIVPELENLRQWARENTVPFTGDEALMEQPAVRKLIERELHERQASLADFERARRFEFLREEPTVENELLTPTRKIRRNALLARYPELVERLYS
jgi:long-chain acyl-CoA synthetase